MGLLSKDMILKADDLVTEEVSVPEWGGEVLLKSLTGTQRDAFEDSTVDQRGQNQKMNLVNLRARLLSLCIVDENGRRMFTDVDVFELGGKNAKVLEKLFDKARSMNGMSDDDVEEMTKGFTDGQSEPSTSD
jgi:hypothetical protein